MRAMPKATLIGLLVVASEAQIPLVPRPVIFAPLFRRHRAQGNLMVAMALFAAGNPGSTHGKSAARDALALRQDQGKTLRLPHGSWR